MKRTIKFKLWCISERTLVPKPWALDSNGTLFGLNRYPAFDPETYKLSQFSGLQDNKGTDIYEGDVIRIAGYGYYTVEFPFLELYEAAAENDLGEIIGNIFKSPNIEKEVS